MGIIHTDKVHSQSWRHQKTWFAGPMNVTVSTGWEEAIIIQMSTISNTAQHVRILVIQSCTILYYLHCCAMGPSSGPITCLSVRYFWACNRIKHLAAKTIQLVCLITVSKAERCPIKREVAASRLDKLLFQTEASTHSTLWISDFSASSLFFKHTPRQSFV